MRKVLYSILLIGALVVGASVLFATGRRSGSDSSAGAASKPAVPLPSATAVAAGAGTDDSVRTIPRRPTRIRVEVYSTAPTADISFRVRSSGDSSSPTDLDDHALPWAAELDAPSDADYVGVTGFAYDRDTEHQVLCRIIVGGVVVESEQKATYASCTFSLDDLDG